MSVRISRRRFMFQSETKGCSDVSALTVGWCPPPRAGRPCGVTCGRRGELGARLELTPGPRTVVRRETGHRPAAGSPKLVSHPSIPAGVASPRADRAGSEYSLLSLANRPKWRKAGAGDSLIHIPAPQRSTLGESLRIRSEPRWSPLPQN